MSTRHDTGMAFDLLVMMKDSTAVDNGYDPEFGLVDGVASNVTRGDWVVAALDAYHDQTDITTAEETIADFLCDLMHLCRMNRIDFDNLLDIARSHNVAEQNAIL